MKGPVMNLRIGILALMAAASLTACGGGGGGGGGVSGGGNRNEVPVLATTSAQAYTTYALGLAPSETAEPLSLDTFSEAPVSDSSEPVAVN
jgi:hypothetical protein